MSKKHHGKHHLSKAELEARAQAVRHKKEQQRVAAESQARTDAIFAARERSNREMAPMLAAWEREYTPSSVTSEVEISPLKVPMKITSEYDDLRIRPNKTTYAHTAFDGIPDPMVANAEVVAMISGKVLYVGEYDPAAGYTVVVGGVNGTYYSYSHLKSSSVKVGDSVPQGATLGIMGNSGNAKNRYEDGCIHVAVHAPDEWLKANGGINVAPLNVAYPAVRDDSPETLKAEGMKLLPHFKRVWPTVGGVELRNGMTLQPGVPKPDSRFLPPVTSAPVITADSTMYEAAITKVPADLLNGPLQGLTLPPLTTVRPVDFKPQKNR